MGAVCEVSSEYIGHICLKVAQNLLLTGWPTFFILNIFYLTNKNGVINSKKNDDWYLFIFFSFRKNF